jgi:hypothetical protein
MMGHQDYRAPWVEYRNRTTFPFLVVFVVITLSVFNVVLWCEGFKSGIVIGVSSSQKNHFPQCGTFTTMKLGQDSHPPVSENTSNMLQGRSELVLAFVDKVTEAIDDNSFLFLNIRGAKSNKQTKSNVDDKTVEVESRRGSIRKIQGRLVQLNKGRKNKCLLLQLTVKYHLATDLVKNIELSNIQDTLISLMVSPSVASEWGLQAVRSHPLQGALLETTDGAWDLSLVSSPTLKRKNVKRTDKPVASTLNHDRTKNVPLLKDAEFLKAIGVTTADGQPRPGMASKVRQKSQENLMSRSIDAGSNHFPSSVSTFS